MTGPDVNSFTVDFAAIDKALGRGSQYPVATLVSNRYDYEKKAAESKAKGVCKCSTTPTPKCFLLPDESPLLTRSPDSPAASSGIGQLGVRRGAEKKNERAAAASGWNQHQRPTSTSTREANSLPLFLARSIRGGRSSLRRVRSPIVMQVDLDSTRGFV